MRAPHIIEPTHSDKSLGIWLNESQAELDTLLLQHGALLLRGFDKLDAEGFAKIAPSVTGTAMDYIEGASPRTVRGEAVYSSTDYSPELVVSLHNELSYSHRWPSRIAFYCVLPAEAGGQTPIARSDAIYKRLADLDLQGMLENGVQYHRHLPLKRGPGVPWPVVFGTQDRSAVEEYCVAAQIAFSWSDDGSLSTSQHRPAVVTHSRLGVPVWFNQVHQWHPSNAGWEQAEILCAAYGDQLPMNATLHDGESFSRETLESIREAIRQEQFQFDWQAGDLMILDNMLVAHGRTPFSGQRDVLVSMGEAIEDYAFAKDGSPI